MTVRPSIQARLSKTVLLISLAGSLLTALMVGYVTRFAVRDLMDSTLQESAEILYGLVQPIASRIDVDTLVMPQSPHEERLIWQIAQGAGMPLVARSLRAPPEPLLAAPIDGFTDSPLGWRVRSMPLGVNGKFLFVAQRTGERELHEWQALVAIIGVSWLIGALSALWLGRRVRVELQPLERLSRAVQAYDPLDGKALPPTTRAELVPVQRSIEELGRKTARLIEQERAFAGHAAHALRTPLAGMDAQLAISAREAPPEIAQRLRLTRAGVQRLGRVVSALLSMFRSTGRLDLQPLELATLVAQLPALGVEYIVTQTGPLVADANLLVAALSNLVDNAVRHGAAHIAMRSVGDASGAEISIIDDGSGIDAETLQRLREGLADPEHGGLAGLGLVLASLVARAHGGRVWLDSSSAGTVVTLRLPLLPA